MVITTAASGEVVTTLVWGVVVTFRVISNSFSPARGLIFFSSVTAPSSVVVTDVAVPSPTMFPF